MNRDGTRKSAWQQEIKHFSDEWLREKVYDVVIVGAGITGVSTAVRLQKAGKRCVLLEASNIGFGTSGGTTAHLNDFFDTTFAQAMRDFGQEKAVLLREAGVEAMNIIEQNISMYNIDCDFVRKSAQLFALDEKQARQLDDIVEGAAKVGYPMYYISRISFPFEFEKAVVIEQQGQFHPIKYVNALCEVFINEGGHIVENCVCKQHEELDGEVVLTTSQGLFKARHLVYATHTPPGISLLHFMNAPYRSYVLAFTLNNRDYPDVLGYDLTDPYHYYRTHYLNGEQLLIAGGEDHKTGHTEDTGECFSKLENYVREHFDVDKVVYSWSSQYYEPVDGLPYIGVLPGSAGRVFTATGFRGNGMMFGSLSSKIITDLIVTGNSSYEKLFSPSRIKPVAGFSDFVKEQLLVAGDFIKDKLFSDKIASLAEVEPGTARVVKYEGTNYAVYKESGGKMHILKSTCPHAKCEVRWNSAEISWDCPCHGSRFNVNGLRLTGPAVQDLHKMDDAS